MECRKKIISLLTILRSLFVVSDFSCSTNTSIVGMEPLSKWRLPDILWCFDSARSRLRVSEVDWTKDICVYGLKTRPHLWGIDALKRQGLHQNFPGTRFLSIPSLVRHVFSSDKHTNDVTMDFGPREKCLKFCTADWIFQGLKRVHGLHADKENEWKWTNTEKYYIITLKNG